MVTTNPISVRITANERHLLETAAERNHTNVSGFIRRKALEAAENEVLDHRNVIIAADDWERFEAWATAPAKADPALRKLARPRPAWRD